MLLNKYQPTILPKRGGNCLKSSSEESYEFEEEISGSGSGDFYYEPDNDDLGSGSIKEDSGKSFLELWVTNFLPN